MIKTWVLHSLLAAITFSIGDLSCKLLLNQSDVELSTVLAITAIFIGVPLWVYNGCGADTTNSLGSSQRQAPQGPAGGVPTELVPTSVAMYISVDV